MIYVCQAFKLQVPFNWKQEPQIDPIHYTSFSAEDLPLNLTQYSNDKVIRVRYDDEILDYLLKTTDKSSIWSKSSSLKTIDVQVGNEELSKLLAKFDLNYQIIVEDVAQTVFETFPENHRHSINAKDSKYKYKATEEVVESTEANVFSELFFKDYRPLETIDAWLDIIEQSFPNIISIETIGETYEGRPYKIVHVSSNIDGDHSLKKTVVITGGIHAREWISVSSVCYQLYALIQAYETEPELLQELDFIFVPVSNPDGYDYTWNTDRLWRKNRQPTILPRCFGIDIDHSYDFHWSKSSDWPCGEEYSGEEPYEAKEAQIWANYLNETNGDHQIYGYIDLHSYSEEILFPYAYSCSSEPRDEENLIELAYGISKAIRLDSGKFYNVLPACQDRDSDLLPDLGSGTALDFMYHNKAFWAYQMKLRDTGNHGFLLPAKYILPVGQEIFAGLEYFVRFITQEY